VIDYGLVTHSIKQLTVYESQGPLMFSPILLNIIVDLVFESRQASFAS
jgi:hypothetical protein